MVCKYHIRLEVVIKMCEDFNNRFSNSYSEGRYQLLINLLTPGLNEGDEALVYRQRIVASIAQSWHDSLPNSTSGRYGSIARALRE